MLMTIAMPIGGLLVVALLIYLVIKSPMDIDGVL